MDDGQTNPWYSNGLNFKCTGCGKCCTGSPGYTWLNHDEVMSIAKFLNLTIEDFTHKYLRRVRGKLSLLEHSETYDCVFLKDKKCEIYPVRPTQCRTYPWWPKLLKSEKDWKEASSYCEGINLEAPLVQFGVIKEQIKQQETSGLLDN